MTAAFLARADFQSLLDALTACDYRVVGPMARDGAIVYDTLVKIDALPQGIEVAQAPGQYRLRPAAHARYFAWAHGPQALKPLVFRARETLWRATRTGDGALRFEETDTPAESLAVIGVRGCDLAALALQDQHFLDGEYPDPHYAARRRALFLVAVHCTAPAATCFCTSTGDGPRAQTHFDLALSELDDGFIVEAGSARGSAILKQLPTRPVSAAEHDAAAREIERAAVQQRRLPSRNLRDALFANLEHPRWEQVAGRCLACGNCTAVCPTCFCHAELEVPPLDGRSSEHVREWDSCFTPMHSYIHGLTIRADRRARYRQWLTHKLGSWHDQYGRSGCVGCGRCITWCPVGIDITEEAMAVCGEGA
jgi:ferredoxin